MPAANWTEQNKNSSTFKMQVKQGVDPRILDVQDLTFNDQMYPGQLVKDTTFAQMQNTVWAEPAKNATTFTNASK